MVKNVKEVITSNLQRAHNECFIISGLGCIEQHIYSEKLIKLRLTCILIRGRKAGGILKLRA